MEVMTNHKWRDHDIAGASTSPGQLDIREIEIGGCEYNILISKNDVVALCAEFGMAVYDKSTQLTVASK